MNVEKIKSLVEELKELDTYNIDLDSEGFLYVERNVEGNWINAFSLNCIVDELESLLSEEKG